MCANVKDYLVVKSPFSLIDSRLKQVLAFFRPPEVVNFHLKSLLETTFAQSKQICSFDDGDTHTRSIDLVEVESAHSAIEVKDSQMKPETPNSAFLARNANGTHQARQVYIFTCTSCAWVIFIILFTRSAYHLHGNFGENFPSNGTGIFLAPKTGTGLSCTIYKIPVNFSLSLDMKPGTCNPNKWYRKFRSFR